MERREFLKGVGLAGLATVTAAGGLGFEAGELAAGQVAGEAWPPAPAEESPRRANTFSICAVNPASGEAGVAVASKCLSVGALVCYAEPGVGAVATQATVNPRYGVHGLELLRKNLSAEEVVRRLVAEDVAMTPDEKAFLDRYQGEDLKEEGRDFFRDQAGRRLIWITSRMRQLGVVDRQGRAATHNGARIVSWSGSTVGQGYCCQGNMLAGAEVMAAMSRAFEERRQADGGSLVAPLLAALEAGEAAGGDKRGKQAAAMLVVREGAHWSGSDRWCDVRVDDHEQPVSELKRILTKARFLK